MTGGRTWVSGGSSLGPPSTWMMLVRLIAYDRACRTFTLSSALLLFGETVLKTMYGLLEEDGPMLRFGSPFAISAGIWFGGGKESNSMSAP